MQIKFRKNVEKLKRTRQILSVFGKYGLAYFFNRSRIISFSKFKKKPKDFSKLTLPERFRLALEELGPSFIKLGQVLSTRPDLIPPSFIVELEKLQDKVLSFDSFMAQKILEEEFNKPLDILFKEFDKEPIAGASLSQVYKAILPTGEIVAVKIQRPNIQNIIELDLEILDNLAGIMENRLPQDWVYHPKLIVKEFRKVIMKEIDFINEAHNYEKFRINFENDEHIKVPKVYWELITKKVLTMEFMEGVKINKITQEKYKGLYDFKKVAERGAEAILKQILEDGFFHADPHPANLFVQPPSDIVMLDVGMVGYLDDKTILSGAKLVRGVVNNNMDEVMRSFKDLGIIVKEINSNQLRQDLQELFEHYIGIPLKYLQVSKINQEIIEIMVRHNLTIPANLVMLIKSLSMVESTGKQLDPDFDVFMITKPFVKRLLRKKNSPKELLKKSEYIFQESIELIEKLPQNLNDILNKLNKGQVKFNFEHRGLEKLTQEIDRSSNRLSFSLIIASLIIGSSMILQQQIGPFIFGYSILGVIGYVLASFFGLVLVFSILKSGNLK